IEAEGYRSVVAVPLVSEGAPLGGMGFYFDEPRDLSAEERGTVQTFADLAAIAIENAQNLEALRARSAQKEALRKVTRDLTEDLEPATVFSRICRSVCELLDVAFAQLLVLDEGTDAFHREAAFGQFDTEGAIQAFSKEQGILTRVVSSREPVAVLEVLKDPDWADAKWAERVGIKSYLGIPLTVEGRVVGVLNCFTKVVREFRAGEIDLMRAFAEQAALALKNAWAFEEIRVRSERQEALRKVTRDITGDLDLGALFSRICESVGELLRVEFAHLFVLDEKTGAFTLAGSFGERVEGEIEYHVIPPGEGILSRVVSRKRPVVVREVLRDPDWVGHTWAQKAGVRSLLGIPLLRQDEVVGELSCFATRSRDFRPDEIELAQDFADQAIIALENARAFEAVKAKSAQIATLNEINQKLTSTLELDKILESILKASKELVGGRYAVFYLYDEDEEKLFPHAKSVLHGETFPVFRVGEGLAGWVAEIRKPVLVAEAQKHPRWVVAPWNQDQELGAFAGLPLISQGALLGMLGLYASRGQGLSEEGFELLKSFADQAAVAIQNARQVESLKARVREQEGLAGALHHIPSGLNVEEVVQAVLAETERVMGTNRCTVMLPDDRTGRLRVAASQGVSAEFIEGLAALPDPFPVGRAYLSDPERDAPTVIPDVGADPAFGETQAREGHRSMAAFPLRVGGRNIGALFFFWTSARKLDGRSLALGQALADQVAVAIQNARLYAEAQRRATTLE
ncbi:MAG: GAF domain-containing protein, partial [Nitrospinota bacterium]